MSLQDLNYDIPDGYRLARPTDTILPYDKIFIPESDNDGNQIGGKWDVVAMDDYAVGFTATEIGNPIIRPRIRMLAMVEQFHAKFDPENITPGEDIPFDLRQLRRELIQEELLELDAAMDENDTVEVLDALCDLMYVVLGTIDKLGFNEIFLDAFVEVHKSNMSKLGEDEEPVYREDGKILKGPDFKEPNLAKFLTRQAEAV